MKNRKYKTMPLTKALKIVLPLLVVCVAISYIYIDVKRVQISEASETFEDYALAQYANSLKNRDYESIYKASLMDSPFNDEETYISYLNDLYQDVDVELLNYVKREEDSLVYYDVFNQGNFVTTLKLEKVDGNEVLVNEINQDEDYVIEVPTDLTITMNGIEIDDTYLIEKDVIASNFIDANCDAIAPRVNRYELKHLTFPPVVHVKNAENGMYGQLKDVMSNTIYIGKTVSDQSINDLMVNDTKILAGFPANETSLQDVLGITVRNSDFEGRIKTVQTLWFSSHNESYFENVNAFNLIAQNDDTVIGYTTFDYFAKNSDVSRMWHGGYQMSLAKQDGNYKVASMGICSDLNPNKED